MLQSILRIYRFQLDYAGRLVADVPADWMTRSPGPGHENHPAFVLGHLVTAAAIVAEDLGLDRDLPAGWSELFERRGPGDPRLPADDPAAYPSREELLGELARQHARVAEALEALPAARLEEPLTWRFDGWMPRLGDALTFLVTTHEAGHLGQLAAWRRAMGLPSAMGGLGRGPDG
jgi:hypothetical protein